MKTDAEIIRILKKENKIARKLYNIVQKIDTQSPKTTNEEIIRGEIYRILLRLADIYRHSHPEIEKK